LLVDFRAHGKSEGNNSTFGVKETDEVEKACNWARSRGNENIFLYGISLGAGVCIKAVSENKVQPVAIIADMPFGSLHEHLKSRARSLGFPSEPFGFLVTMWMGIEKGNNGFRHDVSAYAKKVNCPVLVQWGTKDPFVSQSEVESVYDNLASPNKKLVLYEEAGHESFASHDPVNWQRHVESFLARFP
jgi:alpha-beta hydrolase superfamily lysophospholipase